MALGNGRPRNWGKDFQQIALTSILKKRNVAYQTRPVRTSRKEKMLDLWLTPSRNGLTLPFYLGSCATLTNTRRGRWEATHPVDGRILATGISLRDVVRATIQEVWN